MKRKLYLLGIFTGILITCAGCSDKTVAGDQQQNEFQKKSIKEITQEVAENNDTFDNLDFSNTKFEIPDVTEMSSVVFPVSTDSLEEQMKKFETNIRKFENMEEDKDLTPYMKIAYWDYKKNDRVVVPLKEATEEQLKKIQYLSYNDGSYSELLVFSDYMLEMGNYELPVSLTGDTTDYSENAYGYRGIDLGEAVASYNVPEDDISDVSYTLSDGEMSLQEAIDYVEQHIKEDYYFVGSEYLDYHVREAEVRQLTDEVFYYQFRIQAYYKDVPINRDGGVGLEASEDEDPLAMAPFGTAHRASMFRTNSLDFIWSSCHSYESEDVQTTYKEFISLEYAERCLSQYISNKYVAKIEKVELLYQTEFQYESEEKREYGYIKSIYCHPAYHFTVGNPGAMGYEKVYFDVDAVSGEVTTTVS